MQIVRRATVYATDTFLRYALSNIFASDFREIKYLRRTSLRCSDILDGKGVDLDDKMKERSNFPSCAKPASERKLGTENREEGCRGRLYKGSPNEVL